VIVLSAVRVICIALSAVRVILIVRSAVRVICIVRSAVRVICIALSAVRVFFVVRSAVRMICIALNFDFGLRNQSFCWYAYFVRRGPCAFDGMLITISKRELTGMHTYTLLYWL